MFSKLGYHSLKQIYVKTSKQERWYEHMLEMRGGEKVVRKGEGGEVMRR